MNNWTEMKTRHQEEVNSFPIHFAFGQQQIDEKIAELGLDPERLDKQIVGTGGGGFILKEDAPRYKEMILRHDKEMSEAIKADTTGEGFIHSMFFAELLNHEYGYTADTSETIESLGFTKADIEADVRLQHGLEMAAKEIRQREGFEW